MPALIMAVINGMASLGVGAILARLAKRILIGIGIGLVSYVGVDAFLDQAKALIDAQFGALPANVMNILRYVGVPQAISMIMGAHAAAIAAKLSTIRFKKARP